MASRNPCVAHEPDGSLMTSAPDDFRGATCARKVMPRSRPRPARAPSTMQSPVPASRNGSGKWRPAQAARRWRRAPAEGIATAGTAGARWSGRSRSNSPKARCVKTQSRRFDPARSTTALVSRRRQRSGSRRRPTPTMPVGGDERHRARRRSQTRSARRPAAVPPRAARREQSLPRSPTLPSGGADAQPGSALGRANASGPRRESCCAEKRRERYDDRVLQRRRASPVRQDCSGWMLPRRRTAMALHASYATWISAEGVRRAARTRIHSTEPASHEAIARGERDATCRAPKYLVSTRTPSRARRLRSSRPAHGRRLIPFMRIHSRDERGRKPRKRQHQRVAHDRRG